MSVAAHIFDEVETGILLRALRYSIANIDDVNEAFDAEPPVDVERMRDLRDRLGPVTTRPPEWVLGNLTRVEGRLLGYGNDGLPLNKK